MSEWTNVKRVYEDIEIPEELSDRVQEAIRSVPSPQKSERVVSMKKRKNHWIRNTAAAAAVLVCFTAALNMSPVFAAEMSGLPVLGSVAKVLTFRSYEISDENQTIRAEIPQVETGGTEENAFAADVNAAIEQKIAEYTEEAQGHIAEYKEAFLATGGTEEEFAAKNIQVDVSYEVMYEGASEVSFVITANEDWSNAYGVQYFYNLDLKENRELTLEDILGEDYVTIANESIRAQMEEDMAADENMYYFTPEEGGFETVTEETNFYLNEAGNPVVVFDKYEVAPGAFGRPEFEIK